MHCWMLGLGWTLCYVDGYGRHANAADAKTTDDDRGASGAKTMMMMMLLLGFYKKGIF